MHFVFLWENNSVGTNSINIESIVGVNFEAQKEMKIN